MASKAPFAIRPSKRCGLSRRSAVDYTFDARLLSLNQGVPELILSGLAPPQIMTAQNLELANLAKNGADGANLVQNMPASTKQACQRVGFRRSDERGKILKLEAELPFGTDITHRDNYSAAIRIWQ